MVVSTAIVSGISVRLSAIVVTGSGTFVIIGVAFITSGRRGLRAISVLIKVIFISISSFRAIIVTILVVVGALSVVVAVVATRALRTALCARMSGIILSSVLVALAILLARIIVRRGCRIRMSGLIGGKVVAHYDRSRDRMTRKRRGLIEI